MNEWIWEILPYVVIIAFVVAMIAGSYLRFKGIGHGNGRS